MDVKKAIFQYCDYQERSHLEVRNKLYELGCKTQEVEEYIADLIQENLLNEERYARSIASGKFRIKKWGRKKIIYQLKKQKISEYCIKSALTEIDPHEYILTLKKLAEKKLTELKGEKYVVQKRAKLYRYLLQKGYEHDLINDVYNEIIEAP